jgi:hypothetical protein
MGRLPAHKCFFQLLCFATLSTPDILETRKHNVSEIGSVSVPRPTPLERTNLNPLRTETDPISETLCFLVFRIPEDGQKSKTPVILSVIHHLQNPLESTGVFYLSIHSMKLVSCRSVLRRIVLRSVYSKCG